MRSGSALAAAIVCMALASGPSQAQGCSECRETVGQTPARTQQAYRRGIAALVVAATALASATFLAARRFR